VQLNLDKTDMEIGADVSVSLKSNDTKLLRARKRKHSSELSITKLKGVPNKKVKLSEKISNSSIL